MADRPWGLSRKILIRFNHYPNILNKGFHKGKNKGLNNKGLNDI